MGIVGGDEFLALRLPESRANSPYLPRKLNMFPLSEEYGSPLLVILADHGRERCVVGRQCFAGSFVLRSHAPSLRWSDGARSHRRKCRGYGCVPCLNLSAVAEDAAPMAAYMKDHFRFWGERRLGGLR